MEVDYLIVGQGLAGSVLALELRARGKSILVVDRQDEGSSSRVAAGLITPLTGKGINPAWRQDDYLPVAEDFYRALEKRTGEAIYHSTEVIRLLDTEKEQSKWRGKAEKQSRWGREIELSDDQIQAQYGGIQMSGGAWLDTRKFLEIVKSELMAAGSFCVADFNEDDVAFHPEGITWQEVTAEKIILCQGAYGLGNGGWFGDIVHRSAKGEILTLKIENLPTDVRYHANGWLAARNDGTWKAGSTYDWYQLDSQPTDAGREEVLGKLATWYDYPIQVIGHEAGVRPIIRNSRPVIGLHPEHRQLGFFNGLGSKGSLMAPAVAAHFANYLTGKCDLDSELELPFPHEEEPTIISTHNLLQTAHTLIAEVMAAGDTVIDATLGNGHDTLFLASRVGEGGRVIGFDVQQQAIDSTIARLGAVGMGNVTLNHGSHAQMLNSVGESMIGKISCVMFNLGYLPGADKSLITQVESTLDALAQAIELLRSGGLLTVMCYPGHAGGDTEAKKVRDWMMTLPDHQYDVRHYQREGGRSGSPFLLVANKK